MFTREPEEKITGSARVIATFKGSRKETIIECEVLKGANELGSKFRVVSAMGPAYSGKISSLQVERKNVKIGRPGQQVGIKISNWNKAKVGDLVECYTTIKPTGRGPWKARPGIFRSIA
jgi:translation initiation factor IF-2